MRALDLEHKPILEMDLGRLLSAAVLIVFCSNFRVKRFPVFIMICTVPCPVLGRTNSCFYCRTNYHVFLDALHKTKVRSEINYFLLILTFLILQLWYIQR